MAGRGHKSDSPNAAKYAAAGKLSREIHGYNASREQMIITARKKEIKEMEQRVARRVQYNTLLNNNLIYKL